MKERNSNISTQQKALEINLDEERHGTFVAIGAGQVLQNVIFNLE